MVKDRTTAARANGQKSKSKTTHVKEQEADALMFDTARNEAVSCCDGMLHRTDPSHHHCMASFIAAFGLDWIRPSIP
jgi:hypothetical protein